MNEAKTYLCIGTDNFYAAAECAARGIDIRTAKIAVVNPTNGDNAVCYSVTPKLKEYGIKEGCRLRDIPGSITYRTIAPCTSVYVDTAADIYAVYLKYFSPADIYIYSADTAIIDITAYMHLYDGRSEIPAALLLRDIKQAVNISFSAGAGTNIYLARTALRQAITEGKDYSFLTEERFRGMLWDHTPITDFPQMPQKTAAILERCEIHTMRELATADHDLIYKHFGKNAELLIDHAWGRESCTLGDIKNIGRTGPDVNLSVRFSAPLNRKDAIKEMLKLSLKGVFMLEEKKLSARNIWIGIGYDGERSAPTYASAELPFPTADAELILKYTKKLFDDTVRKNIKIERAGLCFSELSNDYSLSHDNFVTVNADRKRENTIMQLKEKYGAGTILTNI